ncbi:MAG: hemerythrin domain-containing protein [Gallionellaceae bacterium]
MTDFINKAPAPDFSSPLDMLHACHDRIMDQCATLQKLMQHLPMHGCDTQAQQAAQAILRYFDTAGQFHHQDEEVDLFPLLSTCNNPDADKLINQLLAEHKSMEAMWANLRSQLQSIAEAKTAELDRKIVADFSLAYGRHVMLENMSLLPLAAKLLDDKQLNGIGRNMAARRGVVLNSV